MFQEKAKPWHRQIIDRLCLILVTPIWCFYSTIRGLREGSGASTSALVLALFSTSTSTDTNPTRPQLWRILFHYPIARPQLRPTAWLDGLRGVAAFEVMLYHYHLQYLHWDHNPAYGSLPHYKQWWRLPLIRNLIDSGHAMVNVFFLISGFVLTQRSLTLIRTQQHDKLCTSLSSALFRRSIRIYFPAVTVSFVGMLMAYFGLKPDMAPTHGQEHLVSRFWDWVLASRDFMNPFHEYYNPRDIVHPYEHVMWTLPLEIYGSVVCYLTVLTVARVTNPAKRTAVVLLLAWFAAVKQNWWSLNFLVGMMLADFSIWQSKNEKSWSTSSTGKCCWSALLIWALYVAGLPESRYDEYNLPGFDWYYNHVPESWMGFEGGGRFWWMISGCVITICISQLPLLKQILETTLCQYLGRISFMLYLIHVYLYDLVGKSLRRMIVNMVQHEDVGVATTGKEWRVARGSGVYFDYFGFWVLILPVIFIAAGQASVGRIIIRYSDYSNNYSNNSYSATF